jgi:hypothetical protein
MKTMAEWASFVMGGFSGFLMGILWGAHLTYTQMEAAKESEKIRRTNVVGHPDLP